MAFLTTGIYEPQVPLPEINITNSNSSLNMTQGYLVFQPQVPIDPESLHQKTQRATVIAFMGIFIFITLTLTTAVIVFCKKKNSVFLLQKSDLHADLDLELEEIQTDISDDFGSFSLEITDVKPSPSVSNPQDLGQYEALLSNTSTLKQSRSLPLNLDSGQKSYKNLQHSHTKSETCHNLQKTSSDLASVQSDSDTLHPEQLEQSEISQESSGLLSELTDRQTLPAEQLYVFPANKNSSQEEQIYP